jgi:PAS domain S-box-containing protein
VALLYVLAFVPLYSLIARAAIALAALPIILIANAFGLWGGSLAGLLALPLNGLLFALLGDGDPSSFVAANFYSAHVVLFLIGVAVGYFQNIRTRLESELSDRKTIEAALEESERKYQRLVEESTDAVYTLDIEGRFTFANRPIRMLTGYPEDLLVGKGLTQLLVHPKWIEPVEAALERLRGGRDPRVLLEFQIVSGFGEIKWVEQVFTPVMHDDEVAGFQCSARNVTERKQAEEERERLIAELDAFAHTVAHDLKNPLHVIGGYAEYMSLNLDKITKETMQHSLRSIEKVADKMDRIINALMLLSGVRKMDDVRMSALDMKRLLTETKSRLANVIEERQARITMPHRWPDALGFAPWVEEVWVNYVSNALKYGGEPPLVSVGGEIQPGAEHVRFWVRDNGPGLTQDQQDRLFTPFTRLGQIKVEGHGLGLSIVQRIVDKLGGEVGVDSAPGQGSTFWFTLPAPGEDD